jgi:hypothetical protein
VRSCFGIVDSCIAQGSLCRFASLLICKCKHALLHHAQGKGRHEEEALRAAELVLGTKLVPIKGSIAPEVWFTAFRKVTCGACDHGLSDNMHRVIIIIIF